MANKILILNGSPKKDGNTSIIVKWFTDAAQANGGDIEIVNTAFLKYKVNGCISCRKVNFFFIFLVCCPAGLKVFEVCR